jgi:hypothetical protein
LQCAYLLNNNGTEDERALAYLRYDSYPATFEAVTCIASILSATTQGSHLHNHHSLSAFQSPLQTAEMLFKYITAMALLAMGATDRTLDFSELSEHIHAIRYQHGLSLTSFVQGPCRKYVVLSRHHRHSWRHTLQQHHRQSFLLAFARRP